MKILFHTHLAIDYPEEIDSLISRYPDHQFSVAHDRNDLLREIPDADVLVDSQIGESVLDLAGKLKWLFVPFTGVNSIPFEILENRGIRVSNNHGNASLVAERALALALALLGRVVEFDRGMRHGYWFRNSGKETPFVFWESLQGKRALILGVGAIGRRIALLLKPFNCDVAGWRRRSDVPDPSGFTAITESLEEALSLCDICFVALPLTSATRGLIGEKELELLKGKWLINVARGPIVDEKPLFTALKTGRLAGAGLDAWYQYPEPFHTDRFPSEYPFHELDNVVLSPHAGSHAPEGKGGQLAGTLENLAALIENNQPKDIVDTAEGY